MWVATYFPTDRWLSSPRLTAAERKLWENINWCDEATELVHNCDTYRKSPGARLSWGYWCYLLQARTLYPEDRCFDPNFFYLNFTRIAPLLGNILWHLWDKILYWAPDDLSSSRTLWPSSSRSSDLDLSLKWQSDRLWLPTKTCLKPLKNSSFWRCHGHFSRTMGPYFYRM